MDEGKLSFPDGTYLERVRDGKKWKQRAYVKYTVGDNYEGELKDQKRHGYGKYTKPGKWVYTGDFKNSQFHG